MKKKLFGLQIAKAIGIALLAALCLTGCPDGNEEPVRVGSGDPDALAGKLLILTAYGSGPTGVIASHSFVELYNATDEEINLDGYSLYYADGTSTNNNGSSDGVIGPDKPWTRVDLSGKKMTGKSSLLVLGAPKSASGAVTGVTFVPDDADITVPAMTLSNRAFKIAVLHNAGSMTIVNPFDADEKGAMAAGYVDSLGARNTEEIDQIQASEGEPTRCSASAAPRRASLADTNNNAADFSEMRYGEVSAELRELRRPGNLAAGAWDPFEEPALSDAPASETILILQANIAGNNNNSALGSGLHKSAVELYNKSNHDIDLTAGNYYLYIGTATAWTYTIKLEGLIPAGCSFLVASAMGGDELNATPPALFPVPDQEADFAISNGHFKIAVIKNQAALSAANPFAESSLWADYVDMFGVGNAAAEDTPFPSSDQSKPRVPRRTSLTDTNNNSADFKDVDYRSSASPVMTFGELYKYWPRNAELGPWDPMTGLPKIDPSPR